MKRLYNLPLLAGLVVPGVFGMKLCPKRRAAYFKHYAETHSEGKAHYDIEDTTVSSASREAIVLYGSEGDILESYETTYTPLGMTAKEWWYPWFQEKCTEEASQGDVGWWEIEGLDGVLMIKHSNLGGITGIQRCKDIAKSMRPPLDQAVLARLLKEVRTVKYSSLFKKSVKQELADSFPDIDVKILLFLLGVSTGAPLS